MFIENRIKFGYGTVAVGANGMLRVLTLEYIEPPLPVGATIRIEDMEASVSHGKIIFHYDKDMDALKAELKNISADNPTIEFRGYLFDFSNYNPKSVKSLQEMLTVAIMGDPLTWAC